MKAYRNNRGQGMTEYLLIMAAVVALVFILIKAMNTPVKAQITGMAAQLNTSPVSQ
jgi:Flp pilus assembly pilin Flp